MPLIEEPPGAVISLVFLISPLALIAACVLMSRYPKRLIEQA